MTTVREARIAAVAHVLLYQDDPFEDGLHERAARIVDALFTDHTHDNAEVTPPPRLQGH